MSLSSSASNAVQRTISDTLVDALSTVELDLSNGDISAVAIHATNTAGIGDSSVEWQGTVDGTNWIPIPGMSLIALDGEFHYGPTNGDDVYLFQTVGFKGIRARTGGSPVNMNITITGSSGATVLTGIQHYNFVKQAAGTFFNVSAQVDGAPPTPDEFGNAPLQLDTDGNLKVAGTIGLPVGAASEVTLALINSKLVSGTDIGDVTINNAAGAAAVNIQDGGNTITVDGTITANLAAGTNNIGDVDVLSLPAIPAGNNNIGDVDVVSSALPTGASTLIEQQTQTTALQIIDDWDESDRAKVNPIVGQAGVQGGAGAVSAITQRVVLATDQTVIPVRAYTGTCAHTSATATSSSSQALAANANRRYLLIQNNSAASIWINLGGTATAAAPSIMIGVNQTFVQEGNFVSTQAVNSIRTGVVNLTFTVVEGT